MNLPIVSIAAALSFAAISVAPPVRADDRSDIVDLYKKLASAQMARSPERTLRLLSPDFSYLTNNGTVMNGKQFVAQMVQQMHDVAAINKVEYKVTKTIITGRTAKVTDHFTWEMVVLDANGKRHLLKSVGDVENSLSRSTDGWRFLTLQTVGGKMTLDGKPVQQPPVKTPSSSIDKKPAR